jgi:ADP-ribose pyrophosphatase YjhB (NUDIX family)
VNAKLVADVALLGSGRVLLVRYEDTSRYDGQAGWFLPDDYLNRLEHPGEAARRIAREQVGLEVEPTLAEIESFGNGSWHLVFHYRAELKDFGSIRAGANIAAAEWFELDALPPLDEQAHGGWAADVLSRVAG